MSLARKFMTTYIMLRRDSSYDKHNTAILLYQGDPPQPARAFISHQARAPGAVMIVYRESASAFDINAVPYIRLHSAACSFTAGASCRSVLRNSPPTRSVRPGGGLVGMYGPLS